MFERVSKLVATAAAAITLSSCADLDNGLGGVSFSGGYRQGYGGQGAGYGNVSAGYGTRGGFAPGFIGALPAVLPGILSPGYGAPGFNARPFMPVTPSTRYPGIYHNGGQRGFGSLIPVTPNLDGSGRVHYGGYRYR